MSGIEALIGSYESQVKLPWVTHLPHPQRIWFAIYDKREERRLRPRLGEFEAATRSAGHKWRLVDLTDSFAEWMASHEYREEYFEQPSLIQMELAGFKDHVALQLQDALTAPGVDDQTIVAVTGVGSLFGLVRTSDVLPRIESFIRGRLLVFWPGTRQGANYRLLDARDGWNYHAIPISVATGD
jgi:hypothetical protein